LSLGGGDAVLWQWQGVQGFLHPPCHEQMDIPVGSLEQATEMSGHDLGRRPSGQSRQGFPPRQEGLHANEPAQPEVVTGFPHARHAAQYKGDKNEQGGDNNHGRERRERSVSDKKSAFLNPYSSALPLLVLIFKTLLDWGVVYE